MTPACPPDAAADWCRVYILGNSGSGKSWLAAELATLLGWNVHHLDMLRWKQDASGDARDNAQVASDVNSLARADSWIMEGVYGWLAQVALPRATTLIWADLPASECVANIRSRGPQGGEDEDGFLKTIAWAEAYPVRQNSSCFAAHQALFDAFRGRCFRLTSRGDMSELLRLIGQGEPWREGLWTLQTGI